MFGQSTHHPARKCLSAVYYRLATSLYLSTDATRQATNDGPANRGCPRQVTICPTLSNTCRKDTPERLEKIISALSNQVPRLEKVDTELMMSGRRLLKIKDAPFEQPILAKVRL